MASTPETGYLLIADLTGYTAYLASGEIEHAPTIAGDLLETIVGRLEPPFRLAKLEGDAAFLFVEDGRADGSLLLDAVEASYVAFRGRLRSIEQATSCDCKACSRAPQLDLKFFVHHGAYVRSRIAGRDELAGSSIIVVHRLLKGAVAQAAHAPDGRASGFALYTADAVERLGLDADALGLVAGVETIEHIGTVATHLMDLEARWQAESGRRRLEVGAEQVAIDLEVNVRAEPADIWAHLTNPRLRSGWEGPIAITERMADGRRGVGTTAQCVTGRLATLEEVVDWHPYDRIGYRLSVPEVGPVEATYDLAVDGQHTTVRLRWAPTGTRANTRTLSRIRRDKRQALDRLAARLESVAVPSQRSPLVIA
jgi:uncharacterized protein YndB with AHSA1/START domain